MDDDFYCGVVVVDECFESIFDETVERDPRGDERRQVDLAVLHELDGRGVVSHVGDRATEIDFFQDEFLPRGGALGVRVVGGRG